MICLNQERACKHSKSRSHIGNDKKSSARRDEHISIYTSKKVPFQMKPSFATHSQTSHSWDLAPQRGVGEQRRCGSSSDSL